jgi:hypothetical protein
VSNQNEVKALVERLETAVESVITFAEQCTAEQWQTDIPDEGGSVGMVTHHVATAIAPVMGWVMDAAHGRELPPFTREALHQHNTHHAQKHASPDQATTIATLRQEKTAALQKLNDLTDAQLAQPASFALVGEQEITGQKMVEWFAINHCHNHLKSIKGALGLT